MSQYNMHVRYVAYLFDEMGQWLTCYNWFVEFVEMMEFVYDMPNFKLSHMYCLSWVKRGQSINVDILVGLDIQDWLVDGVNLIDRQ